MVTLAPATYVKVGELEPKSQGHNLCVRVAKMGSVEEKRKMDGSINRIAEMLVGDETGCILVSARNEQIDCFQEGKALVFRNAVVDMYQGFMRLNVNQWGKISAHPDAVASTPEAPAQVNTDENMSEIEYELVDA